MEHYFVNVPASVFRTRARSRFFYFSCLLIQRILLSSCKERWGNDYFPYRNRRKRARVRNTLAGTFTEREFVQELAQDI